MDGWMDWTGLDWTGLDGWMDGWMDWMDWTGLDGLDGLDWMDSATLSPGKNTKTEEFKHLIIK
jgi:hypothetical protein